MKIESKAAMRRAIAKKEKEITVEDFVTSPIFGEVISTGSKAILDAHNIYRKIAFDVSYHPEYGWVAYTDNSKCAVNAGSEFFLTYAGKPVEEISEVYNYVLGAVFHEMGHVVYTDFDSYRDSYSNISKELGKGKFAVKRGYSSLYPKRDLNRVKDFIKACHDSNYFAFGQYPQIIGNIFNIVEDGRIEDALLRNDHRFGGYTNGLRKLREKQHNEASLIPDTEDDINTYMNALLNYSKYRDKNSISSGIQDAIPLVDKALATRDFTELYECCKALFVIASRYLDMEIPPEEEQNNQNQQGESNSSDNGSSEENSFGDNSANGSSTRDQDAELEKKQREIERVAKELSGSLNNNSGYTSLPSMSGTTPRSLDEDAKQTSSVTFDISSMESVLKNIAEEKLSKEEQAERKKQCQGFKVDGGCFKTRILDADPCNEFRYNNIALEQMSVIKGTSREIKRYLEQDIRTGKKKRNYGGKNFNASKVVRNDFKYFSDTSKQRDVPKIAIELLIDQSGSMGGDRIQKATESAIILYEMFSLIENLDVAVIGHSSSPGTNYQTSDITRFVDFGRKCQNDKFKLSNISAGGCNYDTLALPYAVNALLAEPADKRILFFICDGTPNQISERPAEEELQEIADDACKKGIDMFILGLGSDSPLIQGIYKNQRFLDISDPKEMPRKLAQLIKKAYQ